MQRACERISILRNRLYTYISYFVIFRSVFMLMPVVNFIYYYVYRQDALFSAIVQLMAIAPSQFIAVFPLSYYMYQFSLEHQCVHCHGNQKCCRNSHPLRLLLPSKHAMNTLIQLIHSKDNASIAQFIQCIYRGRIIYYQITAVT